MPIFLYVFLVTMALGVPIAFCMAFSPMIGFAIMGKPEYFKMIVQRIYAGIDSFPLMAIPFFILAGNIMSGSGITANIVKLCNTLVGHLRGGLGHVSILAAVIISGLSGSAVADASAIGSLMIPAMEKDGYHKDYATALITGATVLGPIIPPSILMVIYSYVMNVSVGGLFAAGVVPGIIIGVLLMVLNYFISEKRGYPKRGKMAPPIEILIAFRGAILPLLTAVIIIGGILAGICTPTESAALGAGYALFLSLVVMRSLKPKEILNIFFQSALASAVVLFIIGTAVLFGYMVSVSQLPAKVATALFAISGNPFLMFFIVNMILLIVGMFMDAGPAILILGPILAPAMIKMGIDPLHFAIVMCVNLSIGLATPPVGLILFVTSSMSGLSIQKISKQLFPFLFIEVAVLLLITYIPALSMAVPRWLGFA